MGDGNLPEDMIISEAQFRDVIERAARAIPPPEGVTIAELREIAAELNIDPVALDRALDRVIGLPVAGHPTRTWIKQQVTKLGRVIDRLLPEKGRLVAGGLLGGIAGWLNAFLMGFSVQSHYPIAIAMVGITLANLLSRRLDRKFLQYLAETFATWGLYAILWSLTAGRVTENLVLWFLLWTSLATVLGWVLVRDASGGGDQPPLLAQSAEGPERRELGNGGSMLRERASYLVWPAIVRVART